MTDCLYRYEEWVTGNGVDDYDDPYPGYNLEVILKEYKIIKRTPKGVWIRLYDYYCGEIPKRFVRLSATKKYACESKEEAYESFKARKNRQIAILSEQLQRAIEALNYNVSE